MKSLAKKLAQLAKQRDRIDAKMDKMKHRHARNLMNEARTLLGRAPITSRKPRTPRAQKKAKNGNGGKGHTFSK